MITREQLMGEGESRREAARRAASGQLGNDPTIGSHGYRSEERARAREPEPEPTDIHEARKMAARRACAGGANSLAMPRALREFKEARSVAESGKIAEAVKYADGEQLESIEAAVQERKIAQGIEQVRAELEAMRAGE